MDEIGDVTISETFQEPKKRFWLRSRKRPQSDAISISSMDISIDSEAGKRKRRRITEVASNIFFPTLSSVSKSEKIIQKTKASQLNASFLSFAGNEADTQSTPKRTELAGNVVIRSWMHDIANGNIKDHPNSSLSHREVKRQEAIYELYCGETTLLNDLSALKDDYYNPLLTINIFNSDELETLFGNIDNFIDLHSELNVKLVELRDKSGFTDTVGPTIANWFSKLKTLYVERCKTQVWARHLLESKKLSNKRFQEFLRKKLESSHAVDLWTYLDVPRSRIVKYPLLVKEILRHTPAGHPDEISLKKSREILSDLLKAIDKAMGEAECELARTNINPKAEYDPARCIENAAELITDGKLKDIRGMKYHCFLFDTGLALTKPVRRLARKYNLSYPVVSKDQICVDVNSAKQTVLGFKVGKHFLSVEDKHQKKHWMDSLKRVFDFASEEESNIITENENKTEFLKPELKRRSRSNMRETHFSFTLRKSLLRPKQNNIDDT